jgi:hypothetical protein
MKVRTVALALTLVAAVVVVAAAATGGAHRPPLRLPAASAFPDGPCRDVAGPVLALARFTYEHEGEAGLPASAYPFLRQRGEELVMTRKALSGSGGSGSGGAGQQGARDSAEQALSARIDAVLTAIGFVRLRPGRAYDPQLLRDLETARAALQKTCVTQA